MPAMWYNDPVSQNRYVKLTGTWNLCWRAKFLEGLTGSVCFLIRLPYTPFDRHVERVV